MTDVPGRTNVYTYDLKLTSTTPIRKKPYPVPQALKETLREEIKAMLDAGIIEPSDSPYCSPAVVVKKKDGTNRHCVDFRGLNNVTEFDAEPMERLDDLFQQIGTESNFVSKIDLSKGYYHIPLAESAKPMTAFTTELGLMQFKILPFGLQGAPAAFSRMMCKVLSGLSNVKNYIDDIVVHHAKWDDHVKGIKLVLQRLRDAGLTALPSKCSQGFKQVEFLGHQIGNGKLAPTASKVEAIRNAEPPRTKKQLRSFLGRAGFYRRYVPNYSAVPVLRLPDFERPFILATDASDTGVGAVLKQEFEDGTFPVVYLSKKLLPREQRYSVVEKECLALVWAVKKLSTYLIGREFIVETDHAPLLYLNKAKSENGRLMRWALLLHQYRFRLVSIRGVDNHGPDFLSRLNG
ncbi:retrovirus-related pol polyprotein from transposon 297 [Plakobranchus ocellatus]|uniref:Retrovirus-related pol polyprotein from transposon 297 n=1 Tax=Plakobranchus ocellatus TaxID=259542 RepID=A0AAV4CSX4_9GAST|nr:retrovirus-related pol polyprotein from transposon 297 [Plakobranchus ocellatus]